jgi:hypothetical protein
LQTITPKILTGFFSQKEFGARLGILIFGVIQQKKDEEIGRRGETETKRQIRT